jgi:uncharacterized membrane protein YdjX (TVP38/TMEM64 family)
MQEAGKYKQEIKFLGFIVILFLIWYCGRYFQVDPRIMHTTLAKLPLFYSGLLYILLYIIVTFFVFFSKDIFWLMGAVLFGAVFSALFICIAEIINAGILFYLARRFGRAYIEKSVSKKYQHLDEKLGRINLFWLFIFRAAPLIPYRFMDLAMGLTKIRFRSYLLVAVLGTPFKIFWIQYILSALGKNVFTNPSMLMGYFLANRNLLLFSLIYPILIILALLKINSRS